MSGPIPERLVRICPAGWTSSQWARVQEKLFALAARGFTGHVDFRWIDGRVRHIETTEHEQLLEPPRTASPDVAQDGEEP